jgi:hypothetical protein
MKRKWKNKGKVEEICVKNKEMLLKEKIFEC